MTFAKLMKSVSAVGSLDRGDVLDRLGLERRRTTFERVATIVGIFSAGILVGAGASLLASPVAPADVRRKIGEGVRSVKNEINQGVRSAKHGLAGGARHAKEQVDVFVSPSSAHRSNDVREPGDTRSGATGDTRNGAIKAT